MPELPEVETICQGLIPHCLGKKIKKVEVFQNRLRYPVTPNLHQKIKGQTILTIDRRAKYILINLENGLLISHLGMSGYFRVHPSKTKVEKHDHIVIALADGTVLHYNDTRRFGLMLYQSHQEPELKLLSHLGKEPLSNDFNAKYLTKMLENRSIPIKTCLMDNKIVVGVGNIYAQESLFEANISPLRQANQLSLDETTKLIKKIKTILKKAIKQGGTTLKDFSGIKGQPGYFAQKLKVYGRNQQPCFNCKTPLEQLKISGRTTCFCPKCQK